MKTIKKYHLISVKLDSIKKQEITNVGEDMEKMKRLHTIDENASWCGLSGKQYGGISKS